MIDRQYRIRRAAELLVDAPGNFSAERARDMVNEARAHCALAAQLQATAEPELAECELAETAGGIDGDRLLALLDDLAGYAERIAVALERAEAAR